MKDKITKEKINQETLQSPQEDREKILQEEAEQIIERNKKALQVMQHAMRCI